VKNLRLYGAYKVLNKEASQLVARAFRKNGHESIDSWPGVSFDHTAPEGQALIGLPIGATIAHMLIGHKAELGVKWINKVSVFNYDANPDGSKPTLREVNIFFHVEDVPQIEIEGPEKDKGEDLEEGTPTLNFNRARYMCRTMTRTSYESTFSS
jgi:hypothetical protein